MVLWFHKKRLIIQLVIYRKEKKAEFNKRVIPTALHYYEDENIYVQLQARSIQPSMSPTSTKLLRKAAINNNLKVFVRKKQGIHSSVIVGLPLIYRDRTNNGNVWDAIVSGKTIVDGSLFKELSKIKSNYESDRRIMRYMDSPGNL